MDSGDPHLQKKRIHQIAGPERIFANRLLKVVANLPLKGIERSIKFSPGLFLHERFLVGIAPAYWSVALFTHIYTELQMPEALRKQFAESIKRANFLGLAFELAERGCVYKIYLEYPVQLNRHSTDDTAEPVLQYHGFKWNPQAADQHGITDYVWRPRLSQTAIAAQFNHHLAHLAMPHIAELMQHVLAQAAARADAREFVFLEVGEAGSTRKSVDLNVYSAGIKLAQIHAQIAMIAANFGVQMDALLPVLERDAAQILGHVSAGRDRNGADFLTIYYDH